MKLRQLFVILALLVCAGGVRANSDALLARLQPQGYVNDFAGVLPAPQRAALETFLTEFERQTAAKWMISRTGYFRNGTSAKKAKTTA